MDNRRFVENAEVIPTAAADPLLNNILSDLQQGQVILSHSAAQRLQVEVGRSIRLRASRKLDEVNERGEIQLQVVAILEAARFSRPAVFVNLPLLIALEQFRDGDYKPEFGLDTGSEVSAKATSFSKVRLYAKTVDDVAPISAWLEQQHIDTTSRLAEINNVKAINQVLTLIFAVIALTALVGCIASLIGAFLANIDRKRKDLAVLRLLGFTNLTIALYVIVQALMITVLAYIVGLALYGLASGVFNQLLVNHQSTSGFASEITLMHAALALGLSVVIAVFVSCIGALRAIRIQPAESLREL